MNSFLCDFCKKDYSSKRSLDLHQKSAKFCLRLRNNHEEQISFYCEYCNDNFTLKHVLERHYENCKIRFEKIREENEKKKYNEILELKNINSIQKDEILELKRTIENLKNINNIQKDEILELKNINSIQKDENNNYKIEIHNN
jgi:uncharacterized Zn finger protein (UPF0148 family)